MLYGETHKEVLKNFTIKQFPQLMQFGEKDQIDKSIRLEITTKQENIDILQNNAVQEDAKNITLVEKEDC